MGIDVLSLALGFVLGQIALLMVLPLLRVAKDEPEAERTERSDREDVPVIRETSRAERIYAETTVFARIQPWETADSIAEERLKRELANRMWEFVWVTKSIDQKTFDTTYRAKLDVLHCGHRNILCADRNSPEDEEWF